MNCTLSYYTKPTRMLLSSLGVWPFQKSVTMRYTLIMIFGTILLSGIAIQLTPFYTKTYSAELLLQTVSYSAPWLIYLTKYIAFAVKIKGTLPNANLLNLATLSSKCKLENAVKLIFTLRHLKHHVEELVRQIQHDWNTVESEVEKKIMQKHAMMGRRITLLCTRYAFISVGCFAVLALVPNFVDFVAPLNESRKHTLPVTVEYFVDQEKYFCIILLHLVAVAFIGFTIVMGTETIALLCTLHICARFEIVHYRIRHALDERYLQKCIMQNTVAKVYEEIISGIKFHMQTVESYPPPNSFQLPSLGVFITVTLNSFVCQRCSSVLQSTIIPTYYIPLPLGVLTLSIHLYRISVIRCLDDFDEFIVTALFIIGYFGYLFFGNCILQLLTDYTAMLFLQVYNTGWYSAPLKIQKIVLHLLQRSVVCPSITIAGLFSPSLEGFLMLVTTSMSYCMLIRSVQQSQ